MARRLVLWRAAALACALLAQGPTQAADAALVAAAKREGEVTWYTSLIVDQFVRPAAAAFEKKYGIHVDYIRMDIPPMTMRLVNEAKSGRVRADVFDAAPVVVAAKREGLALRWSPEGAARLGPGDVDVDGYWTATNRYVATPGVNTELVPRGTEPRSWDDLLDPKWRGKMAWSANGPTFGAIGFVGLALAELGESKGREFLRKLAAQQIAATQTTSRQLLDMLIAGEYPIALQINNTHAVISAARGAPSDWIPMSPAFEYIAAVAVSKGAPHGNAAKLLVDFLLSTEGQTLYREADYLPVDPALPDLTPGLRPDGQKFRGIYFSPEKIDSDAPIWKRVFEEIFN